MELVLKDGSTKAKLARVREFAEFAETRKQGNIVHYWHLHAWTRQKARKLELEGFKAFSTFLLHLKLFDGIVLRKITKFVTRLKVDDELQILETGRSFLNEIN